MSSGLLNLTRNVGGAFGIALFGTLLADATNSNVLLVAQNSVIRSNAPQTIAQGVNLIILKADLLSYGTVFVWAAGAMFVGALAALVLLRANTSDHEVPPEARAEAMAG